jgi:transcriptional regulator with XRE-family HTH domain
MIKTANVVDAFVGARIHSRRQALGIGIEKAANAIGVSCERMKDFEAGTDRISARLLAELAAVLDVDASHFFEPTDKRAALAPHGSLIADAIALNRAFALISDPIARRRVVDFAMMMAASARQSAQPIVLVSNT